MALSLIHILDSSFTTTQRTKTWENVTIKEIGTEIAGRAGIALAWDVEGDPFTIKSVEQSEQTDCEFYMNLCNTCLLYTSRCV